MTSNTTERITESDLNDALELYAATQVKRARALYNLPRAMFAESLVADALGGASLDINPANPWDMLWPHPDLKYMTKIQVKCSGAILPLKIASGPGYRSRPVWNFPAPKSGSHRRLRDTGPGRQCHLIILARHEGEDLGAGWHFWLFSAHGLPKSFTGNRVTERRNASGATELHPAIKSTLTTFDGLRTAAASIELPVRCWSFDCECHDVAPPPLE